ncbi:MAG: lipoprotein signal peptidase [Bacteroidetes bacterium]|nr:MAG: lipoprotein signal peptidase [Bacteroidota bacterium]
MPQSIRSAEQARKWRWITLAIMLAIILADQVLKVWIKTHMFIGEDISLIGEWARLRFVENNGIAFGMQLAGRAGKLLLSCLRIAMVIFLAVLAHRMLKSRRFSLGLLIPLTCIIAGALGNIIDGTLYGLVFSSSQPYIDATGHLVRPVATFLPSEGGYAGMFFGRVVDMFYFPLFSFQWPTWLPMLGGKNFLFFNAIFNIADAAITCAVFYLLLFQRRAILAMAK